MKALKRMAAVLVCLVMAAALAACGKNVEETSTEAPIEYKNFVPGETGIFVDATGKIYSGEVAAFDNSGFTETRYDEEGLRSFVEEEVASYNTAKAGEAVTLESLKVENGKAYLVLSYDTPASFLDFQGTDFGVTELSVTDVKTVTGEGGAGLPDFKMAATGEIASQADTDAYPGAMLVSFAGSCNISFAGELVAYDATLTLTVADTLFVESDTAVWFMVRV